MISDILIITGDWHLRKDVPICRTETEEQWQQLQFDSIEKILKIAVEQEASILHTGDLYHQSQPYYGIVNQYNSLIKKYPDTFITKIAGNHDLPYHDWMNVLNSGWMASEGKDATWCEGACHYGRSPKNPNSKFIITHQLVFETEKDRPIDTIGKTASELLMEFPKAEWIFTGDYHKNFHYKKDDRHVVNPGCLTRQAADFEKYVPGFYLVKFKTNSIKWIPLEIDTAPLKTEHLQLQKDRESRMDAFIEMVQKKGTVSLSFEDNLKTKLSNKSVSEDIRKILIAIREEIK